ADDCELPAAHDGHRGGDRAADRSPQRSVRLVRRARRCSDDHRRSVVERRRARYGDRPCAAVCPVNCFYTTADAVVLHSKDLCIGCGYCFYACPFGAPQYPRVGNFGSRGKMDKCTYCAGGPEADNTAEEYDKYGANRLAEGKLPMCAEMCSTKS